MKKTESITYRTDSAVRQALSEVAKEKKWSVSLLTEEIVKEWLLKNYPELLRTEE